MQPGGRLGRPAQVLELPEQALEVAPHARRRQPRVGRRLQLRTEAPHPVELWPGDGEGVLLRQPADVVVVVQAERRRAVPVQRRQPAPEPLVEVARGGARAGSAPAPGTASDRSRPTPPARWGRAAPSPRPARRGPRASATNMSFGALTLHLHEQLAPVGEPDLERVVDVPAAERARPDHARAERRRQRGFEARVHPQAPCARRRWSSSPRQARSQMSNTSSKPARAAVVGIGHVGFGRRAGVERAQQAHLGALRRRRGAMPSRSSRFERSIAMHVVVAREVGRA